MTIRQLVIVSAASVACAIAIAGCSEPAPAEPPADGGAETPPPADEPDDQVRDDLGDALASMGATLTQAADRLRAAEDASGRAEASTEVDRALDLLLDDPDRSTDLDAAAVLPATTPERETIGERDDLLSATTALARDIGGATGTAVTALLRDELAGDLGAWERDAEGVVATAERAAADTGDLDAATATILELPGETTRALAWAFLARDADDLDTVTTAAGRAASHLELATLAIDDLLARLGRIGSTEAEPSVDDAGEGAAESPDETGDADAAESDDDAEEPA